MKNKREKDMKNRFADTGKSYAGYFLRFVFCLVLTASALSSQAQSRNQVSGKVTDTAGEPLIGATVVVVGTTTGTTTGIDGSYTINAAADSQQKTALYAPSARRLLKRFAPSCLLLCPVRAFCRAGLLIPRTRRACL